MAINYALLQSATALNLSVITSKFALSPYL